MTLWRWVRLFACVSSLAVMLTPQSLAAHLYEVTGRVIEINADEVVVKSGDETFRMDRRDGLSRIPPDLRVGDRVDVTYRLQAIGLERRSSEAEPGAPQAQEPGTVPHALKPLLDDRAFFNA